MPLYQPTLPLIGTGRTVTVSTPLLDLTQTWNAGAVTFTGLKLNVTNTASAAASLLLDLQVATVSQFSVSNAGVVTVPSAGSFGWSDVLLRRDAANILAQRNGTSAQVSRIYNTFTDASNGEWAQIAWSGNDLLFGTAQNGTGSVARQLFIQGHGQIRFFTGSTLTHRWSFANAGDLIAATDNTVDIGASGASRPRNVYAGTAFILADGVTAPGATVGSAKLYVDTSDGDLKVIFGDGVIKTLATDT